MEIVHICVHKKYIQKEKIRVGRDIKPIYLVKLILLCAIIWYPEILMLELQSTLETIFPLVKFQYILCINKGSKNMHL